jgi:hypothetical protein
MAAPVWQGESLRHRTLLVHAEQGFGDSIQFCRYLRRLPVAREVVFEVPQALARLMEGLDGVGRVVVKGEELPPHDVQIPLMSLPHVLAEGEAGVAAEVPYLRPAPAEVGVWRRRLEGLDGLRVGVAWAGNPAYPNDRRRSMRLARLAALGRVPGVTLVSLQKGEAGLEVQALPEDVRPLDWTAELTDFAATAALIRALDLVVAVDTAVVHLAGALGRPVWLLNRFDTCWRWLRDCGDSPWYPTLRQFRQPWPDGWEDVVADVAGALPDFMARKMARRELALCG